MRSLHAGLQYCQRDSLNAWNMNAQRKQFALRMLSYAVQRGVDAADLCKAAGIDLARLKSGEDSQFGYSTMEEIWRHAQRLCNDPLFGLHFAESLQLAALGAV